MVVSVNPPFLKLALFFFQLAPPSSGAYLIVHEFSEIIASSSASSLTDSLRTLRCVSSRPGYLYIKFLQLFHYLIFLYQQLYWQVFLISACRYLCVVVGKLILKLVHHFAAIINFTSHIVGCTFSLELLSSDVLYMLKYTSSPPYLILH